MTTPLLQPIHSRFLLALVLVLVLLLVLVLET